MPVVEIGLLFLAVFFSWKNGEYIFGIPPGWALILGFTAIVISYVHLFVATKVLKKIFVTKSPPP